jgi:hypothetical protein
MRGQTVGGTNLYSTISLANNATTTFHTIQGDAGTGGWLSGTIKIDATTDYAIPFFCFFSRQLDGTTYNVAAQFGSDIPSGLSITNSGSAVRVVMPNLAGFSSASVTYCVQAAANGTTLPVSVSASSVLGSTSGVAPAAGVIGENIPASLSNVTFGSSGTDTTLGAITLPTSGVYLVFGKIECSAGGTTQVSLELSISLNSTAGHRPSQIRDRSTALSNLLVGTSVRYVVASAGDILRLIGQASYSGTAPASVAAGSQFYAVRIG